MTEAGLDMDTLTDGQKVVELLEKKSDIDVKLFFEVQTTIQVGSSFSSNRADQAWGQLQMGMLQMGISGLGSFLGGVDYFTGASKLAKVADAVTKVVAQNAVSYAGSGFHMNEDGSIGYKGPSKGALYSTLVSTGFGAVGAGINAGTGAGGWQAGMVSTTANALGAGFQFNDDGSAGKYDWGKAGVSFAANTASTFASYGTQVAMKDAGYGRAASGVVANQVGRAANVLTASLLGDQNAYQAYMPQGFFSTVGTNLGDVLADRFNNRHSQRPSSPSQPLREIFGGATMITARREEEEHEDEERFIRLLTLSDTAEAQDELAALAARGAISGEQYAAAARQILANGVKDGGTAKLPLVATNSDRLFGNLGKQYGASSEEMEFRYVMANNPGLDPNDGDAYAAARDNLRAKIEKGGVTINMPTGVGEYTGQTDKQFGYNTIRAERAVQAQYQQQALMAGYGANPTFFGLMEANMIAGQHSKAAQPPQWISAHANTLQTLDDLRRCIPPEVDYGVLKDPTQLSESQRILALVKASQILPQALPAGVILAAKTGSVVGVPAVSTAMRVAGWYGSATKAQTLVNATTGGIQGAYSYLLGNKPEERTWGGFAVGVGIGVGVNLLGMPISGPENLAGRTMGGFVF